VAGKDGVSIWADVEAGSKIHTETKAQRSDWPRRIN
jgi:hypothetical protein